MTYTTFTYGRGHGTANASGQISLLEDPLDVAFRQFHHAHPHVYDALVTHALKWQHQGHRKCGIGMLFELFRWDAGMTFGPTADFKLNNNYRSRYARLIMANEPGLNGFFETRALDTSEVY